MRIDRVVVNSSPLITLFNSGQAELLPKLFSEVLVPDAVWLEVAEGGHQDIAAQAIRSAQWIKRLPPHQKVRFSTPAVTGGARRTSCWNSSNG